MALTKEEKDHLLSLVPVGAPSGLKLNWNAKVKRWYYYLSKVEYSAEKHRGVDHRLIVGYEEDGKFHYTQRFLLLQRAQKSEEVPQDVKETSTEIRTKLEKVVKDKRLPHLVVYPIDVIFTVAFLACLSGVTDCVGIADYWKANRSFLEKLFDDFPKSDISHDTIRKVFMLHKPDELSKLFKQFTKRFLSLYSVRIVGIDGQMVKATKDTAQGETGRYVLNVFDITNGMCLAQKLISKKTNEIPAAQTIIKTMDLNGCVVTADALHTQTKTAKLVTDAGGNYCLALKKNQDSLYEYVVTYFERPGKGVKIATSEDDEHGRLEERTVWVLDSKLLPASYRESWIGLDDGCIVRVQAKRTIKSTGEVTIDNRYYISSLAFDDVAIAQKMLHFVRQHWGIENSLHHVLDVNFLEDRIQCKRPTYLKNRTLLIKLAHNVHAKYLQWLEKNDQERVSRSRLLTLLSTAEKAAECWQKVLLDGQGGAN